MEERYPFVYHYNYMSETSLIHRIFKMADGREKRAWIQLFVYVA